MYVYMISMEDWNGFITFTCFLRTSARKLVSVPLLNTKFPPLFRIARFFVVQQCSHKREGKRTRRPLHLVMYGSHPLYQRSCPISRKSQKYGPYEWFQNSHF